MKKTVKLFLQFNLIRPTYFDVRENKICLRSISVEFTPTVQWLRQTIQIDAPTGIYDWVRGRLSLHVGTNTFTINKINFETAIPMASPPVIGIKSGLQVGDIDFSLTDVPVDMTSQSEVPDLDGLILKDDLAAVFKVPQS
jgi:hypothetical protein